MAVNLEHPWKELVLDGVGEPRFLIVGDELCSNQGFETDLTGWEITTNISRVADTTTFYGDYVMKILDDNAAAEEYAYFLKTLSSEISGRKFVFTMLYKNAVDGVAQCSARIGISGDVTVTNLVATQNWQTFTLVKEFGVSALKALYFEIYPYLYSEGVSEQGSVLIDNVSIREVIKDYVLPCPKVFHQKFEKELQAKNELLDGTLKTYIRGWRYKGKLGYEFLGKTTEYIRRELAQYVGDIVFFPHRDIDNCILVNWDGDYAQRYFKDRYIGHEGIIPLEGVQLAGQLLGVPEYGGINIEDQILIS